jgi:hypothetical protein
MYIFQSWSLIDLAFAGAGFSIVWNMAAPQTNRGKLTQPQSSPRSGAVSAAYNWTISAVIGP